MHLLIAVIIAALATWGLRQFINRVTAAGQQRYAVARTRLAGWRATQSGRPAPPPSPLAIKVGAVFGGAAQGVALAWGAGVPGLRLGWAVGRERVRGWWEETRPPESLRDYLARNRAQRSDPEPQPTRDADGHLMFGGDPSDPNGTGECPECHGALLVQDGQEVCPACLARQRVRNEEYEQEITGRPNLRLVTNPQPAGGAVPVIETIGEVNTIADARTAVQAVIDQCVAECDDAAAEAARKHALYVAAQRLADQCSARVLDRDPEGRAAVTGLVEPARQQWLTAQARKANCDAMLAQAQAAMAKLNAHRPMEEAAAATPQASTRTETYKPQ